MGKSDALITVSFIQGFSLAILMRFSMDISPAGIMKNIFPALEPYAVEQTEWVIPVVLLILTLLPFIAIFKIFLKHGIKGIIVYGIIVGITWYIVMSS